MDCMAEQKQVGDSSVKDFSGMIGISSKFAVLNRLITRDLNNNTTTPTFSLYSKEDVPRVSCQPYTYEKQIVMLLHIYMVLLLILEESFSILQVCLI